MPISARMKKKKMQDLNASNQVEKIHNNTAATLDDDHLHHQLKQTANFGQNQKNETEELRTKHIKTEKSGDDLKHSKS